MFKYPWSTAQGQKITPVNLPWQAVLTATWTHLQIPSTSKAPTHHGQKVHLNLPSAGSPNLLNWYHLPDAHGNELNAEMLRLQQKKSSFTKQPSEMMGEQVSDPCPWRQGACYVHGLSRVVSDMRKVIKHKGKNRYNWCYVQVNYTLLNIQIGSMIWGEGAVFWFSGIRRPFVGHLHRPSFHIGGCNQLSLAHTGWELTPCSNKKLVLHGGGKVMSSFPYVTLYDKLKNSYSLSASNSRWNHFK